ncbi:MAG: DUF309 domain-containing protein, partial [Candidatus Methylomirabilales bacterium]
MSRGASCPPSSPGPRSRRCCGSGRLRTSKVSSSRSPYLEEGTRLFRAGEYFLAHETWEERWIEAAPEERDFYQG